MVVFHVPPTGDRAHNPGMYPDWELNLQPFGSQNSTQSTEPHQPELENIFNWKKIKMHQNLYNAAKQQSEENLQH